MPASPPASCGRGPGSVAFPGQRLGTVNQHFPVRGWHRATTMVPPLGTGNVPPHPKGGRGSGWHLAPMAPSNPFLGSSLTATACCQKTRFQCTQTHQNPPKHPKNSAPSLPPRARHVPVTPLHQNTWIQHLPRIHKRPCSGWEGAGTRGHPPSPPTVSCLPGAGPGPGADGPSRHGRAAQHGALGHGKARHSSSGCDALLRPGLPGHTPTCQEDLGFPRATCRPCQDCPMSPKPVTRTRANTPQTFLAINRPPLHTAPAEPCSLLRSCPPPRTPKSPDSAPKPHDSSKILRGGPCWHPAGFSESPVLATVFQGAPIPWFGSWRFIKGKAGKSGLGDP